METEERLVAKVDDSGGRYACRPWSGRPDSCGYGRMMIGGKAGRAHRAVWEACFGAIPTGMCVRHTCDNPACCNPFHMLLGTHSDNMRDMSVRGRQPGRQPYRFTASVRAAMIEYMNGGATRAQAARKFGCSWTHANDILKEDGDNE